LLAVAATPPPISAYAALITAADFHAALPTRAPCRSIVCFRCRVYCAMPPRCCDAVTLLATPCLMRLRVDIIADASH